jgi:hypothetical protein
VVGKQGAACWLWSSSWLQRTNATVAVASSM